MLNHMISQIEIIDIKVNENMIFVDISFDLMRKHETNPIKRSVGYKSLSTNIFFRFSSLFLFYPKELFNSHLSQIAINICSLLL